MTAPLWSPTPARNEASNFTRYLQWLEQEHGLHFSSYRDAWQWSVTDIEQFWESLWHFFGITATTPYETVLTTRTMPGAQWFPGAQLNYAQHAFRNARPGQPAILFQSESQPLIEISWDELHRNVAAMQHALRALGIERGDRVAALLPNIPEAVIAFLACASIGAVWSSCSPDFGAAGIIERFRQIEPKLLIATDGYAYAAKKLDRRADVSRLRDALPSVQHIVLVPYLDEHAHVDGTLSWPDLLTQRDAMLEFESVPFEHPLWILFSSGTTGPPKGIVHGHGGIVLEHLKSLVIQNDMKPGDRFFWYTTTGWMMWNVLVSGLLAGCTIVLYDGSALFPDDDALWRLAQDARITRFGGSAAYFTACMNRELRPGLHYDLHALRAVGSTGSPLSPEVFHWIYDHVERDVWLASSSGGTDVATAFLCGCPWTPVYAGELQGAALGVHAAAFDEHGNVVTDGEGELVIRAPLPSMPLYLWHDADGSRYHDAYFDTYPGVWRHGDRVTFNAHGGAIIHGRSDATLNRLGVRIGTSEIYRAVESIPAISDSLVVGLELSNGGYYMPLFVALRDGVQLDDVLQQEIRNRIRTMFTPRHVPDDIIAVSAIPRTLNGKKLEVPVKKILLGAPLARVVNLGSVANPESLSFFADFAATRSRGSGPISSIGSM